MEILVFLDSLRSIIIAMLFHGGLIYKIGLYFKCALLLRLYLIRIFSSFFCLRYKNSIRWWWSSYACAHWTWDLSFFSQEIMYCCWKLARKCYVLYKENLLENKHSKKNIRNPPAARFAYKAYCNSNIVSMGTIIYVKPSPFLRVEFSIKRSFDHPLNGTFDMIILLYIFFVKTQS